MYNEKVYSLKHTRNMEQMIATSSATRRKEISWEDDDYLKKVHVRDIGERSQVWLLEGKASIGPCFRDLAPNVGKSGIFLCVPKKCPKYVNADFNPIPSVVNINVSKKCFQTKSKILLNYCEKVKKSVDPDYTLREEHVPCATFFGEVRSILENLTCKIINVFNI